MSDCSDSASTTTTTNPAAVAPVSKESLKSNKRNSLNQPTTNSNISSSTNISTTAITTAPSTTTPSNNASSTTSNPSQAELNSTNVFAFGLHSSYSAFANDANNTSSSSAAVGGVTDSDSLSHAGLSELELLSAPDSTNPVNQVHPSGSTDLNSNLLTNHLPLMHDFNPYFFMGNLNLNPVLDTSHHNSNDLSMNGQSLTSSAVPNAVKSSELPDLGLNYMNSSNRNHMNLGQMTMSHMPPLPLMNMNPSICKFFAAGHCARGAQCNYAHIDPNNPQQNSTAVVHNHPHSMNGLPGLHMNISGSTNSINGNNHSNKPYRNHRNRDPNHSNSHSNYNHGNNFHPRHSGLNHLNSINNFGTGRPDGFGMNPMFNNLHLPPGMHAPVHSNLSHNGGGRRLNGGGFNSAARGFNQHSNYSHERNHHRQQHHHQNHPNEHFFAPPPHTHNHLHQQHITHFQPTQSQINVALTTDSHSTPANPGESSANDNVASTSPADEDTSPSNFQPNSSAVNKLPLPGLTDSSSALTAAANLNFLAPGLQGLDPSFLAAAAMQNPMNNFNHHGLHDPNHPVFDPNNAHFFHPNMNNPALMNGLHSDMALTASAEDLQGRIYSLARDQYGCRLLQRLLDDHRPGVIDVVYEESFEHVNELMTDPFGNYLCQKLIEHSNETQRLTILHRVSADLVAISLNLHGTRAVQKLVESINTPAEVEILVNSLKSSVVILIKDLNGNHVIQRALHHLSANDNQFIYNAVSRHCVSVATHKHGCCVLQRCIDYATASQRRQLVNEIIASSLELVQDPFGNYVVQYVLDLGEPNTSNQIIANLLGHIYSLSVQKFSSNVIEKCLELANDKMRGKVVDELINMDRLPRLLQDPYANYVIQKALSVSKKSHMDRLVAVIKPHLGALKNTAFGKRIQNKIAKRFPDLEFNSLENNNDTNASSVNDKVSSSSTGVGEGNENGFSPREESELLNILTMNPEINALSDQLTSELDLNSLSATTPLPVSMISTNNNVLVEPTAVQALNGV